MCRRYALMLLLGMTAGSSVMAQQAAEEKPVPCSVQPVFHCTQRLADGIVLGHFGYTYSCADGSQPKLEMYIDLGEENLFSPGPADRGQSTVFWIGKNVDAFEVEFTPEELEKGVSLAWKVRDKTAKVDYAKTGDADLDCTTLP